LTSIKDAARPVAVGWAPDKKGPVMTLLTILALGCILGMFVSFVAGLGGVTLWMALLDRRDRMAARQSAAQAKAAPAEPRMRRAA
jgi:hypothetical protein